MRVNDDVTVGVIVGVSVGVGVIVGVGVGVAVGVGVGVRVGVGVGVGVGVAVGVGVGVEVEVGVGVGVGVAVGVGVGVGVGVAVGVGVDVGDSVVVGIDVGAADGAVGVGCCVEDEDGDGVGEGVDVPVGVGGMITIAVGSAATAVGLSGWTNSWKIYPRRPSGSSMMYHPLPFCQVMATTSTTVPSSSRVMIGNCNPGPSRTFECCITRNRGGSVGVGGSEFVGATVAGGGPSATVGAVRTVAVGVGDGAGSALLA